MPRSDKLPRDQIVLRKATPDDAESLYEVMRDPLVYPGLLQMPYPTAHDWRTRLEQQVGDRTNLHLLAEVDGEVVGSGSIFLLGPTRQRHIGQIGMSVRGPWQGRGVGRHLLNAVLEYGDRWLGLTRIQLDVYTDNTRAIGLYESAGFATEGCLRAFAMRDGMLVDTLLMARLRAPVAP